MDVRCERCNTEYEFDDALVSWRGTTVKCTSCGHKFRIARGKAESGGDLWRVQTRGGKTLVFTSLRELQKAIQAQRIKATDTLSRGGSPSKPIDQIPELLSFFERSKKTTTAPGLGPTRSQLDTFPDFPAPPAVLPNRPPRTLRSLVTTLVGTGPGEARSGAVEASVVIVDEVTTKSAPEPSPPASSEYAAVDVDLSCESGPVPESRTEAAEAHSGPSPSVPSEGKAAQSGEQRERTDGAPTDSGVPSSVRPVGRRWSAGLVVTAAVILVIALLVAVGVPEHVGARIKAATVASAPVASAPVASVDSKVVGLLEQGEKAFVDGDIERAKENFDKATALSDNDPRALVDVARLAAVRADVAWLKVRLLPEDAADERRITQDDLNELAAASRGAAEQALQVLPDNHVALSTKIDALRASGDRDGARALAAKFSLRANDPEDAYVLAALGLAEQEPPWATIIERLRVAAGAEVGPGRARAALIYALARSGDVPGARVELEQLAKLHRIHPLFALLRAFTERAASSDSGNRSGG
ncbi:MAG: zinc-ribbon domain-containing protein [Polyangiaceae bacterium]|nr:zinc-ribbon domain-containing protein [Polyangiaceae bacterium]